MDFLVYSDYAFTFSETGHKIVKGWNNLDGAGALAFARERKQVPGGDEGRGKHQMKIIAAVIEKALSPALLLNYTDVLESVKGNFATDMSYDLLASLVRYTLSTGMDWEIISHNVSGTNTKKWLYSLRNTSYAVNDCMLPNSKQVAEASKLLQAMLRGERITDPKK
jgi:anionic cell wall polymer biosynthesis LytR-Cps2A-Psr (LCP) family protein